MADPCGPNVYMDPNTGPHNIGSAWSLGSNSMRTQCYADPKNLCGPNENMVSQHWVRIDTTFFWGYFWFCNCINPQNDVSLTDADPMLRRKKGVGPAWQFVDFVAPRFNGSVTVDRHAKRKQGMCCGESLTALSKFALHNTIPHNVYPIYRCNPLCS